MIAARRFPRLAVSKAPALVLLGAALLGSAAIVVGQLERGERGVAPVDSSANFEVGGVEVDVSGPNADAARQGGWRLAQRRGWKMLWARANGRPAAEAPNLSDSTLDAIVAGIEVENEQIAPRRYIARLGILFDRARAGQLLGGNGGVRRSAPMLVIPVMWSGGTAQSFESRTEWQKAWARFRSGGSPIDYVRPIGTGVDPLLLNAGQVGRPGRGWWRMLLDQYGAADVLVPIVRLTRSWPGGPVVGRFQALHGPDGQQIASFTLTAPDGDGLPRMLDEGVRRMDAAFGAALRGGQLAPDPSLVIEDEIPEDLMAASVAQEDISLDEVAPAGPRQLFSIQVDTPDAAALTRAEQAVRGLRGVVTSSTASLALGGVSVIRAAYAGDAATLRATLEGAGLVIRGIRNDTPAPPPAPAAPAPAAPAAPPR